MKDVAAAIFGNNLPQTQIHKKKSHWLCLPTKSWSWHFHLHYPHPIQAIVINVWILTCPSWPVSASTLVPMSSHSQNDLKDNCLAKILRWLSSNFFLRFYLFIHERHRERERQRHKQAPCREPGLGLNSRSPGSHPGLKAALNHWATQAACFLILNSKCLSWLTELWSAV